MIDKIKTILTITLIVIFVFAVGYSIVKVIIAAFEEPILITKENLNEYIKQGEIVTSYSTYNYYESCMKNLMKACENEMYNELYNIYINDYAENKDQVINELKNIKKMLTPKDMDEEIIYKLEKLYVFDNDYIAEISINANKVYIVFNEISSKNIDYNFAVIR